jgi:hypothetical protein
MFLFLPYRLDQYMCPETYTVSPDLSSPLILFVLRTYTCVVYPFFSRKAMIMSSRSSPTQFYERRKKSQCDVDAGEGGSRSHPPRRQSKRIVHRDFPRGHVHIDTEIVEGDPMETSDDVFAEDEIYRMSPVPPSKNSTKDQIESNDSRVRQEVEEEEEGMIEETLNPRSQRRAPFNPSPTIWSPHKPSSYHVTSYEGQEATKQEKKLWKVDPRSQL